MRTRAEPSGAGRPTSPAPTRVIAEGFAVLDRAGRLQLPADYIDALELERRVRLELEEDHVGVWPDRPTDEGEKDDK